LRSQRRGVPSLGSLPPVNLDGSRLAARPVPRVIAVVQEPAAQRHRPTGMYSLLFSRPPAASRETRPINKRGLTARAPGAPPDAVYRSLAPQAAFFLRQMPVTTQSSRYQFAACCAVRDDLGEDVYIRAPYVLYRFLFVCTAENLA
jgi:hypothetical protein